MDKLKLTFWMNHPAFYQRDLFNALQQSGGADVRVYYAHPLRADRRSLGWETGEHRYSYRHLSARFPVLQALSILARERDRVHIVNGIWSLPLFLVVTTLLRLLGSTYFIYSEGVSPRKQTTPWAARLKAWVGRWVGSGKRAGVLAVARFARDLYTQIGFAPAHVYPFGYFEAHTVVESAQPDSPQPFEVLYVGQLIHRKGIDVLLEALYPLFDRCGALHLTLIGDGKDRPVYEQAVAARGFQERVTFAGVVASPQIRARMARAQVVVLPSRWDGWGMVVNEALSVGVPVVVSDHCGASDVIVADYNGAVFPSEDARSLSQEIERLIFEPDRHQRLSAGALASGALLSAEAVVPYLLDCIRHRLAQEPVKPAPPWVKEAAQ